MSSGEELEAFEITDHDLQSELNPQFGRRQQTKEQAIYGVWANSDDEEEGNHRRKARKNHGLRDDVPMGFVSGGSFHDQDGSTRYCYCYDCIFVPKIYTFLLNEKADKL